jgi:hypothetical protein
MSATVQSMKKPTNRERLVGCAVLLSVFFLADFAVLAVIPHREIKAVDHFGTWPAIRETLGPIGVANHGEPVELGSWILASSARGFVPGERPASLRSVGTSGVDLCFGAGGTALASEGGGGVADFVGVHGGECVGLFSGPVEMLSGSAKVAARLGSSPDQKVGIFLGQNLSERFGGFDHVLGSEVKEVGVGGRLKTDQTGELVLVFFNAVAEGLDFVFGGVGCHGLGWLIGALSPADERNLPNRLGFARTFSNYFHGPISGLPLNAKTEGPPTETSTEENQ